MARRKLIWHIGLAQAPRSVIGANLAEHGDSIEEAGVRVVANAEESGLATHEILRTHRAAGLSRKDVEGRWARICDRVWDHKGVSVLSTPDLCAADKDQLRFALDPLIGIEVHLVVTLESFSQQLYGGWLAELRTGRSTGWDTYVARVIAHAVGGVREHAQAEQFWAGHELVSILARWGWTLHADRLHVVADADVAGHWWELARLVGLPADELPCVVPPCPDPAGAAVLRKVNRRLDARVPTATLGLLARSDPERSAAPVARTGSLLPLVERWRQTMERLGHDVRGDLAMLTDEQVEHALPGPRDQLDRKRRRWKRRAQATRT